MAKGMKSLGKNIEYSQEGVVLTIVIDTSKEFGPSASGKTIMIASTQGNKSVGDIKIGINAYRYPDEKKAKARK